MAETTLQQALGKALSLRHKVMIAENGFLIKVSPVEDKRNEKLVKLFKNFLGLESDV